MPQTFTGASPQTYTFGGEYKQMLLNNTHASNSITVKVNGDTTGFTIEAGGKRGLRINKGMYTIAITGPGSYELSVF